MEKVAEAKVLIAENVCDKCGKGRMRPHGFGELLSYPPQQPHVCENCGHVENYAVVYPYHRLVPVEPLREPTGEEIPTAERL